MNANIKTRPISTMTPREGGGFVLNGPITKDTCVYPDTNLKGDQICWLMIEDDDGESVMLDIGSLDHLIEALTSIRDSLPAAA